MSRFAEVIGVAFVDSGLKLCFQGHRLTPEWTTVSKSNLSDHPYASFLHEVQKPARYTGEEYQSVKKDWDTTRVRICMAFPDIYDIGMSHLGTKIIYSLLRYTKP